LSASQTNSGTVLGRIVEARREEVARRQKIVPETVLRMAVKKAEPVRDFAGCECLGIDQRSISARMIPGQSGESCFHFHLAA